MWLPLLEYAIKHDVSTSTIRRRIKNKQVKFKIDNIKNINLSNNDQKDDTCYECNPDSFITKNIEEHMKKVTDIRHQALIKRESYLLYLQNVHNVI